MNTYVYVEGNPVTRVDPKGLVKWSGWETGGSISLIVGAGVFFYELESECVDERKAKVVLVGYGQVSGVGAFLGSGSWTRATVDDGKSSIDPGGLAGFFGKNSASAAWAGIRIRVHQWTRHRLRSRDAVDGWTALNDETAHSSRRWSRRLSWRRHRCHVDVGQHQHIARRVGGLRL